MANICSNYVEVLGEGDKVLEFVNFVSGNKDDTFDFQLIIPLEDKERGMAKWGCNSIAFDTQFNGYEDDDTFCDIYFWTKYNPPHKIYEKLVEQFPDVHIRWRYEEPGCGLFGYLNADMQPSDIHMYMAVFSEDSEPDILLFENGSHAMGHLNHEVEKYCKEYGLDKEKDVTAGMDSWHFETKGHQMTFTCKRVEIIPDK